ncbi:hypothetical protein FHT76_008009 [Rhizobium sp. BK176]|nr:hypothetical protein [Rhizobium sp. BK181]MBB3545389.1 hypothetical protein [Rhizobium sp. BK399]MCS3743981.1 hypothetical protein [Rhizobium sp. BK661]MCS4096288.1 hypothetical protein [Rhizobium sp. BK176]
MTIRRAHHSDLDTLIAQSGDTSSPLSFDRGPPLEFETKIVKEINRRFEILYDDSYIVHPLECHVYTLQCAV